MPVDYLPPHPRPHAVPRPADAAGVVRCSGCAAPVHVENRAALHDDTGSVWCQPEEATS